jgi:ribonuclease E
MRILEEEATKDRISQLVVQVPVAVATFILNDKRSQLAMIEQRHGVRVVLVPNPHLETPHYEIERLKDGNIRNEASHEMLSEPEIDTSEFVREKQTVQQAAVTGVAPTAPAPVIVREKTEAQKPSLLKRLLSVLTGKEDEVEEEEVVTPPKKPSRPQNRNQRNNNERRKPRRRKSNDEMAEESNGDELKEDTNSQPKAEGDDNKPKSANGRRSRRGGRRRRPRNEQEQTAEQKLQAQGNVVVDAGPEVNGNEKAAPAPEVDGNLVTGNDVNQMVDGNAAPATSKPRRRSNNGGGRRRRPTADKNTSAASDNTSSEGVAKNTTSVDNGNKESSVKAEASATADANEA